MRESEHDHFQGLHVLLCHSAVAAVHSLARYAIMHLRNIKLRSFLCTDEHAYYNTRGKVGYRHTVVITLGIRRTVIEKVICNQIQPSLYLNVARAKGHGPETERNIIMQR